MNSLKVGPILPLEMLTRSKQVNEVQEVQEDDFVEKQVHFFTFGLGHALGGHFQPIIASSEKSAYERMFEVHGSRWAFHYTEKEYLSLRQKGTANEIVLPPIEGR